MSEGRVNPVPAAPLGPDPAERAELYAVGALSAEEAAAFERDVRAGEPGCVREFARVRPLMEAMLAGGPVMEPDAGVLSAVMAAAASSPAGGAGEVELSAAASRALGLPVGGRLRLVEVPPMGAVSVPSGAGGARGGGAAECAVVVAGAASPAGGGPALVPGAALPRGWRGVAGRDGCRFLLHQGVAGWGEAGPSDRSLGDGGLGDGGPVAVSRGVRGAAAAGWLAAAAALALAAVGWLRPVTPRGGGLSGPDVMIATVADLEAIAAAEGTRKLPVLGKGRLESPAPIGEFVWNSRQQRGFLRLARLDSADPAQGQYQGWFFDGSRDGQYPVSAGLFDVPRAGPGGGDSQLRDRDGNLLIPIKPDLPVGDMQAFAVTVERPGGVVVTDKKGLVLLAAPAPPANP